MKPQKIMQGIAALSACAITTASAAVTVEEPWVRTPVPGQNVAAGYMKLRSTEAAAVVNIRTPVASQAEIHEMTMEGGVMKMRRVSRLTLPADRAVELKPGSYHVMLMNIVKPLKDGDKVPLTLIVEEKGKHAEVRIKAEVRSAARAGMSHEHHH